MEDLKPRRRGRYPAELRERAVRMVFEAEPHSNSQWAAICSIAEKLGPTPEAVRRWVRQAEIDRGDRGGLTTEEHVLRRADTDREEVGSTSVGGLLQGTRIRGGKPLCEVAEGS